MGRLGGSFMKTKVLHVIERFNVAGAEVVVRDLLKKMDAEKWAVEVCVLHDIGVIGKEMSDQGYPIHFLNWEQEGLSDAVVAEKLRSIIERQDIDIVHAHNVTPWYFSYRALRKQGKKICVTIHGFIKGPGSLKKKLFYIFLSRFTDQIVMVSESIKKDLAGLPLMKLKGAKVIVNGIELVQTQGIDRDAVRREIGLSENDFVIGTVGRLFKEKNIEMQIEMIGKLLKDIPNIKLVVVSKKYDYIKKLEKLIGELGVGDHAIFTGLRRDIPRMLSAFDVFVMTSVSEGTSIALLEAMSAGLPIVVSRVGGNPDVITHAGNGFLFDVNDLPGFCKLIHSLYIDTALRSDLAVEALKSSKRYAIENMVEEYGSLYQAMSGL